MILGRRHLVSRDPTATQPALIATTSASPPQSSPAGRILFEVFFRRSIDGEEDELAVDSEEGLQVQRGFPLAV